jgi:hypothetical protein
MILSHEHVIATENRRPRTAKLAMRPSP